MRDARPRVIVTADDMGLRAEWDAAILRAYAGGVVTSVSLVTNGPRYDDAKREVLHAGVDRGLHLNVTDGEPLSPCADVATLVDARGRFHSLRSFVARYVSGRIRRDEVTREWTRQSERAVQDGLSPSHVNAHCHLHMAPGLFGIAADVAAQCGIRWIRFTDEPPWHGWLSTRARERKVATASVLWLLARSRRYTRTLLGRVHCRGIAAGGALDLTAWRKTLARVGPGTTEIACHPGQAADETDAVLSQELAQELEAGFRRSSFRDLPL